jgi:type IV secretory pathway VirB10-like protein
MIDSPDMLGSPAGRGIGVRRLNRRPLMIASLILCLILIAAGYTYQVRLAEIRRRAGESAAQPEPVGIPAILKDAPDAGFIPPRERPSLALPAPLPIPTEKLVPPPEAEPDPYAEEWARYRQEVERQRRAREQAALQAIRAPTPISRGSAAAAKAGAPAEASPPAPPPPGQLASNYALEALRRRAYGENGEARDLNRAAEKRAFLTDRAPQAASAHYLPGGREAPLSPYDIKAGTVIPATMVTGTSSDLPGQIIGQVAEHIHDTATGRFILIPQGSKLIGDYDNAVTTGQERVLIAWTRIILPDASSIDLGKMPGADQSGLSGLHDKVNTHFWKMVSSALMLSVLSAGVQISQGGQNPGNNGLNAQQSIAAGLGQQFGELGQTLAERNSRIQPTLEVRPGMAFTVMVTRDMALRPWIPHRQAKGKE